MDKLRIGVITASVREGRMGDRVARWFAGLAAARPELEIVAIDLKDWPLPPYAYPKPPKVLENSYTDERERGWAALIAGLDGYVVVTPEYNHGYPPSLKNALDYVYTPWTRKPMAFVSYGGSSGGTRSVQQLRQVAIELQMAPLRDEVNIPFVGRALDAAGNVTDDFQVKRAAALLDGLIWWARALKTARTPT